MLIEGRKNSHRVLSISTTFHSVSFCQYVLESPYNSKVDPKEKQHAPLCEIQLNTKVRVPVKVTVTTIPTISFTGNNASKPRQLFLQSS